MHTDLVTRAEEDRCSRILSPRSARSYRIYTETSGVRSHNTASVLKLSIRIALLPCRLKSLARQKETAWSSGILQKLLGFDIGRLFQRVIEVKCALHPCQHMTCSTSSLRPGTVLLVNDGLVVNDHVLLPAHQHQHLPGYLIIASARLPRASLQFSLFPKTSINVVVGISQPSF